MGRDALQGFAFPTLSALRGCHAATGQQASRSRDGPQRRSRGVSLCVHLGLDHGFLPGRCQTVHTGSFGAVRCFDWPIVSSHPACTCNASKERVTQASSGSPTGTAATPTTAAPGANAALCTRQSRPFGSVWEGAEGAASPSCSMVVRATSRCCRGATVDARSLRGASSRPPVAAVRGGGGVAGGSPCPRRPTPEGVSLVGGRGHCSESRAGRATSAIRASAAIVAAAAASSPALSL